jgi:hypothetical protein
LDVLTVAPLAEVQTRRDELHTGHGARRVDVVIRHFDLTARALSLVCEEGFVGPNEDDVARETHEIAVDAVLQPGAETEQQGQHQHPPKDAESREEDAQLVAAKARPYLFPRIEIPKTNGALGRHGFTRCAGRRWGA